MCGIAGYFGSRKIDAGKIASTLQLMKRRGPNNQAWQHIVSNEKSVYFLHARLSIIDKDERANQPFFYKNKMLIYNGEIYNYLELRKQLEGLGHQFLTTSDTEVLIHAMDEWGENALDKLEGMWAFALFDKESKRLTLCRDRFGEKPLYYYEPEWGEIYFASEIKFISSLSGKKFSINQNRICSLLVNGYKSLYKTNENFFEQIKELPRASIMKINAHGIKESLSYWPLTWKVEHDMTIDEAVNGVKERLIHSVEKQLRADTPIAFCMSGGVDSNSLIAIAKKYFNYTIHGFTILNTDVRYEEKQMIDVMVDQLKIEHTVFPVSSGNFVSNLKEMIGYYDAPVTTITRYLNWLLHQSMSQKGYHVSISGVGADETLSGYYDHHLMYLYEIQNENTLYEESILNWKKHISPIVRNPFLQSHDVFIKNPFLRDHIYLDAKKYASYLKSNWTAPFHEIYYRDGLLQNRMANEMFHEITPTILHDEDLNAMYFSIENRSPFLDRALFEFSHSVPAKYLVKEGKAKAILREAMVGLVPDEVLSNKRKVGFNAPVAEVMNLSCHEIENVLLDDSPIFDIVKKEPIKQLIASIRGLPNSDNKFLFSFLSAKLFLEEFL